MTDHDLLFALALQNVSKIGDVTAKKLIAHCGSIEAVFKEKKQNLMKIDGIGSIVLSD
ncbi:MAG: DNA-protecting protein DprA, partial [Flavobacteriaceae bacterium]|nr:DNA-protecting protein DprA [Flavobacteriaceae bacterium]